MRKINLLLLLLGLGFTMTARENNSKKPVELSGSLLWKISGNGLSKSSYILGSYHLETKDFVEANIKGLNDAFAACNVVVGEVDMTTTTSQQNMMKEAMRMPADTTYQMLLSPEDYTLLDQKLTQSMGVGLQQMGIMSPNAILSLFLGSQFSKISGKAISDVYDGMDVYFLNKGKQEGKKIKGLETWEEQVKVLFYSDPLQKQALDLLCGLQNEDLTITNIQKLDSIYKKQNLTAMYELSNDTINDPCYTSLEFMNKLTTERNNNWMTKLPPMLSEDANFIVVGALHLCGKDGILQQLLDKGYTVTPVK